MNKCKFLLAAAMLSALACDAATYYVATTGNDSAVGTNAATAWRTIQKAANTVVAGDLVRVQPGTYIERVTETTDGTSANKITYLADGAVQVRGGFYLNGSDYIRLIGFEVTQADNPVSYGYEMIRVEGCRGVELIDLWAHHAGSEIITFRACNDVTVRGCTLEYPRAQSYPWRVGTGAACLWMGGGSTQTNVLIEANVFRYSDDYFNGTPLDTVVIRNNVFGPTAETSGAHLDNVQPNGPITNLLIEANWDEGNNLGISDPNGGHHLGWFEAGPNGKVIIRGNVLRGPGCGLGFVTPGAYEIYHNTWYNNATYNINSGIIGFYRPAGNQSRVFNNIFYYSVSPGSSVINYFQGGTPVSYSDYNGLYASGTMAGSHNVTTDPQLTTASALVAGSSARNAAGVITLTANAGNSATALTVNSTSAFWPGDSITVGGTAATISTINSSTSITLASPISWTNGAPVVWRGQTDLGALPYRAGGYGYDVSISSPTGSVAQGNVTITAAVTNPAVVRFVESS